MTNNNPNSAASLELDVRRLYDAERDCLMYCALRFDGYAYEGAKNYDIRGALEALVERDVMPTRPGEQMAIFFILQRYLGKWGGEYEGPWGKFYQAYRRLFLLCYGYEVPPEYVMNFSDSWDEIYKPQAEAWADLIRRIDAATVYNRESGLVLSEWRPPVDAYEVVQQQLEEERRQAAS